MFSIILGGGLEIRTSSSSHLKARNSGSPLHLKDHSRSCSFVIGHPGNDKKDKDHEKEKWKGLTNPNNGLGLLLALSFTV